MLGVQSILPLMKGWDYKITTWTRKVTRGQTIEVERVNESGYLWSLILTTDDCYGGFKIDFQGADLRTTSFADTYPKLVYDFGALAQDPSGWVQRYYRPNPQSSQGAYVVVPLSSGFQGTTMPYVPSTVIQFYLRSESTQVEATISLNAIRTIITDKAQYIKSLRAIIGANMIQEIDPVLLSPGPTEVTQKGWSEKEQKK